MRLYKVVLFAVAIAVVASCAKQESESYNLLEQNSLDAWMKMYHPAAERLSTGVYIERCRTNSSAPAVEKDDWVMINYTGTNLAGDVYGTRYKSVAEIEGTFALKTHYAPQYLAMHDQNYGMIQAQYDALRTMNEDDSVNLYIPSKMGYGTSTSSFTGGFAGQTSLAANVPSILHLTLMTVVKDPTEYENKLVTNYAFQKWNKAEDDTLKSHLFFKSIESVEPTDLNKIGVDSTVKIFYKGYYLDGFIFDTNIDTVAQRVWKDWATKSALSYKPSTKNMIDAFYQVVPTMRMGDKAKFVFTSKWAYGANGSGDIPPYSPLVFEIYIEPRKAK